MNALARRTPGRTPRLVTKADAEPQRVRAVSERYAHDRAEDEPELPPAVGEERGDQTASHHGDPVGWVP